MFFRWIFNNLPILYPLIGRDSAPCKSLNNILLSSGYKSLRICVFNSENKVSASLFCIEIVVKCCPHPTYMQWTCWTWCKTNSCSFRHFISLVFDGGMSCLKEDVACHLSPQASLNLPLCYLVSPDALGPSPPC